MKTQVKTASDVEILIMIDTEYVKEMYPQPSKDPVAPTGIGHNSQFMICTGYHAGMSNGLVPTLNFSGNAGNRISLKADTVYSNANEDVVIYGVSYLDEGNLYNNFLPGVVPGNMSAIPGVPDYGDAVSKNRLVNFTSCNTAERQKGLEKFLVYFALYRWDSKHLNQELIGYYYWDPALDVA